MTLTPEQQQTALREQVKAQIDGLELLTAVGYEYGENGRIVITLKGYEGEKVDN